MHMALPIWPERVLAWLGGRAWVAKMAALFYEMIRANQQARDKQRPLTQKRVDTLLARFDRHLQEGLDDHQDLILCSQEGREDDNDDV